VYDATGELEMTDLDIDEFMASGAIDEFFKEMMHESGMLEEMMETYGDDVDINELQASFESFFKASMGFSDGICTALGPPVRQFASCLLPCRLTVRGTPRRQAQC